MLTTDNLISVFVLLIGKYPCLDMFIDENYKFVITMLYLNAHYCEIWFQISVCQFNFISFYR